MTGALAPPVGLVAAATLATGPVSIAHPGAPIGPRSNGRGMPFQLVDEAPSASSAAAEAGIKRLWIQPGAESHVAIESAQELGLSVIAGGPCLLVALGYKE